MRTGVESFGVPGLSASLGLTAVLLSGCSAPNNVVFRFGWPEGITPQAERMRELWTWSVIAALIMGVLVWGLTFWTVYFHRKSRSKTPDEFPKQFGYNVPLELGYTAAPFVIISVLFYFTVVVQNYVEREAGESRCRRRRDCVPMELEVRLPLGHRERCGVRRSRHRPRGRQQVLAEEAAERAKRGR